MPGETIDFMPNESGKYDVLINGDVITETYTKEGTGFYGDMEYPYTVPQDCYFVRVTIEITAQTVVGKA